MAKINLKTMVSFVILCSIFIVGVFPPFFSFVFSRAMRLAGLRYLTAENVNRFVRNPVSVLALVLIALLFAWAQLVELSGIIYIYDQSRNGRKTSFAQTFFYALMVSSRLFSFAARAFRRSALYERIRRRRDSTHEEENPEERKAISFDSARRKVAETAEAQDVDETDVTLQREPGRGRHEDDADSRRRSYRSRQRREEKRRSLHERRTADATGSAVTIENVSLDGRGSEFRGDSHRGLFHRQKESSEKKERRRGFGSAITILLVILLFVPALHLTTLVNGVWTNALGARLMSLIRRRWYYSALFSAGVIGYFYLFLRWMYVCHYYILEGVSAKQARRASSRLSKEGGIEAFVPIAVMELVPSLLFVLIIVVMLFVTTLVAQKASLNGAGVSSLQMTLILALMSVLDAVTMPLVVGCISSEYYERRRQLHEKIRRQPHMRQALEPKQRARLRVTEVLVLSVSIGAALIYLYGVSRGRYVLRIEHLRQTTVTAHRGASMSYPENTLAAIEGAIEQGADWVEIDVNESRDGQIFLMHDSNFKRTTGVDANAWELDYDQIAQLDAGSFFSTDFAGERVPLLSEAIALAQANNISLNIEIKPTGHEKHIVESVVSLVEEAGFTGSCVITSQQYRIIQQIKKLDENIRTVYVMGLAYGAINRLGAADAFSIRSTSITQSLVSDLHNRGIEVYAWTVDSRDNMNRMINLGVDNIITNNVPLAIECVNDSRNGRLVSELLKSLRETFS